MPSIVTASFMLLLQSIDEEVRLTLTTSITIITTSFIVVHLTKGGLMVGCFVM